MFNDVFIIIFMFLGYSVLHSLFSGLKIKTFFLQRFPNYFAFYRITFNIIQSLLFVLLWYNIPKPDQIIWNLPGWFVWIFRVFQILSLTGLLYSFTIFNKSEFLGFRQIHRFKLTRLPQKSDEIYELTTSGPYAISRHPIYLFTISIFLFEPVMTTFKLLMLIWLVIYFYVGSIFEEKRLIREFGQRYLEYRNKVSRILPIKWLKCLSKKICKLQFIKNNKIEELVNC